MVVGGCFFGGKGFIGGVQCGDKEEDAVLTSRGDSCSRGFAFAVGCSLDVHRTISQLTHSTPDACIGPRGTYFGKLLVIVVKQAKVDGCKPSFQARLSKLSSICP